MDLQEALRILDAAPGADRGAIRQAYLRALKACPPERDPQGFQRVRAAFELAQRFARRPALAPQTQVELEPSIEVASAPPPDPLARFVSQVEQLETLEEQAAVAREAVREVGSLSAYQLLTSVLDDGDHDAELASVLREGIERGHAELFAQLRERCPDALSKEELAAWSESVDGQRAFALIASQWLARDMPEKAAQCLLAGYERLAADPFSERPVPWFGCDQVLALLEQGRGRDAQRVWQAFCAAYPQDLRGPAARVAITHELVTVFCELDGPMAARVAAAVRQGRPELADGDVSSFAALLPRAAREHAGLLRERAPILASFYATRLAPPARPLGGTRRSSGGGGGLRLNWVYFWVAMTLLRTVFATSCNSDRRESSNEPPTFHEHQASKLS